MENREGGKSVWAKWVWLNGEMLPEDRARISIFDRGFLYGDGVFETVRAVRGKIFRWTRHRERLQRSLTAARIVLPFSLSDLESGMARCLEANALEDARIRTTITRGEGGPGLEAVGKETLPTVVVAMSPWRPLPPEKYRDGVPAIVSSVRQTGRQNLDPALKSTSRVHLVLARLEATQRSAHEAILLGLGGEVTEGTVSNVFLVRSGRLCTPSLDTGILEGVTREVVLELASAPGRVVQETRLTREDLDAAEEIFMTNTSWGVLPVTRLDDHPVGSGSPGPFATELGRQLKDLVERECGG